jgi:hypothetical protein
MSVTTTTSPYRDHRIVVHKHAIHGWMSTMRDAKGKCLGEQVFMPALDKAAVIERATTLAGWFGIAVDVREDA